MRSRSPAGATRPRPAWSGSFEPPLATAISSPATPRSSGAPFPALRVAGSKPSPPAADRRTNRVSSGRMSPAGGYSPGDGRRDGDMNDADHVRLLRAGGEG